MLSLMRRAPQTGKADPAPSRWAWRMQRLMLTPAFRFGLRVGVPLCLTLSFGTLYLADEARRTAITDKVEEVRRSIQARPEFMVKLMAIDGAEGTLAAAVRAAVPMEFPRSSFDIDLPEVRRTISALDGVRSAGVRVRPGGILQIDVVPRVPVAVWRSTAGLTLVDEDGVRVAELAHRGEAPSLPLIVGDGAAEMVPEALDLLRVATGLGPRVRGVARIGERRWDIVLDRDQRILLPETGAVQALERVVALQGAQELLTRDVAVVDMRMTDRPTVRMNEAATQALWQMRQISGQ